jgi:hypothetical protein
VKITRRQLKQLILEAMDDSVAYPTSDDTDAGYINAVLDELKEDFIEDMWPTVEKMEWETDKGLFTNSNEGLVMEALAVFNVQAQDYRAQVRAALNDVEIKDGSTPTMPMNASKVLSWMMGLDSVDYMMDKFDSILSLEDFEEMTRIIKSHDKTF